MTEYTDEQLWDIGIYTIALRIKMSVDGSADPLPVAEFRRYVEYLSKRRMERKPTIHAEAGHASFDECVRALVGWAIVFGREELAKRTRAGLVDVLRNPRPTVVGPPYYPELPVLTSGIRSGKTAALAAAEAELDKVKGELAERKIEAPRLSDIELEDELAEIEADEARRLAEDASAMWEGD